MKSQILWGVVDHRRNLPVPHLFSYPLFMAIFNLNELDSLSRSSPLFSYNHFGVISLYDRDYLSAASGSIREKLTSFLSKEGFVEMPEESYLVTMPRVAGYVFNPVSFYFNFSACGAVHSIVAEVNNTFGEKHLYAMKAHSPHFPLSFSFPKTFFVSPFFDRSGSYDFNIKGFVPQFNLSVSLCQGGGCVFDSSLRGEAIPFSGAALLSTILRYPLAAALTMIRIHYQAFILYLCRSVAVFEKPAPTHHDTVRADGGIAARLRLAVLSRLARFIPPADSGPGSNKEKGGI